MHGCAMMGAVHGNAANTRLRAHHSAHCAVVSGASVPNSLRRIAMASGSALGLNGIGWGRLWCWRWRGLFRGRSISGWRRRFAAQIAFHDEIAVRILGVAAAAAITV